MKRSTLTALGLEKAIVDTIMDEHGQDVELLKERHAEALEALKSENKGLKDKLAARPADEGEDWKAKFDEAQEQIKILKADHKAALTQKDEEFSAYKTSIETEQKANTLKSAVKRHLKADGARPEDDTLEYLASKFDLSTLELDGENIKDWDSVSKAVKASAPSFFGKTETKGVDVANPPASNSGAITMDDVKKMTPKQINENWDKVKTVLDKP